jgi:hypothetical protein
LDVEILEGRETILDHARLLERFAERCCQYGAMHWLGYFLGGMGARWKRPCMVVLLRPGADRNSLQLNDLRGAALFYEFSPLGLRTRAYSTDDWEGLRTVIAEPALRHQVTALATQALIRRGAHVVLTTYSVERPDESQVGPLLRLPGTLWAERNREVTKQRLLLGGTYEETLAKFGKQTRTNLRYYRKRLLAQMDCEFIADALPVLSGDDLIRLNSSSLNPLPVNECRRRYQAVRELNGGYLIALRGPQQRLLSVIGGWRQGTTTVMHHQMNAAGYEKSSLGTVMRSYFLESEVARGTRTIIFYHGTNHTISHAFEGECTRDLVVRRKTLHAAALKQLAGLLASPRYYAETHYFGGSTTFFASVLTSDRFEWHSAPDSP